MKDVDRIDQPVSKHCLHLILMTATMKMMRTTKMKGKVLPWEASATSEQMCITNWHTFDHIHPIQCVKKLNLIRVCMAPLRTSNQ